MKCLLTIYIGIGSPFTAQTQVSLPSIHSEIRLTSQDITTFFPSITNVKFTTVGNNLDVELDHQISFINFQKDQTEILKKSLEKYEKCGDRLKITGSRFFESDQLAYLTLDFRFEKWMCLFDGTTRLGRQSGTVKVRLKPQILNNNLRIVSEVVDIQANGVLGSLLASNSIKEQIIDMIGLDESFEASLPEELEDLDPKFNSVKFLTVEDAVSLKTNANLMIDGEQLALLMNLGKGND